MVFLKKFLTTSLLIAVALSQQACVVGYLVKSSYHQQKLLRARTPLHEVLEDPKVDKKTKDKLRLAQESKVFAETDLHLKKTDNYNSYVHLDRPYVSWIVRVSDAYDLKAYDWWFPIVGSISYKGYFTKDDAIFEAKSFSEEKYDTYVRGVTAYSTLGWFSDPILSSMIRYEDHDLVELIIHESVHATLYIKSSTEFNERLATFIGRKGALLFYKKKEGADSPTLKAMALEEADNQLFSKFISEEIDALKNWYTNNEGQVTSSLKTDRLKDIQQNFKAKILPKLKTSNYNYFADIELNNAKLLPYETYVQNLDDFEALYASLGNDMQKFLNACKTLEGSSQPEAELSRLIVD